MEFPNESADSQLKEAEAVTYKSIELKEQLANLFPDLAQKVQEHNVSQQETIMKIYKGISVLVSACKSSDKTLLAAYAIAHASTVVYAASAKTICNQIYRDFFREKFDVEVLTEEFSLNSDASCLIMTIETLRTMLYRGYLTDIEWVIIDEVYVINDFEKGVLLEEIIIKLPKHIKLLLLSALSIPNASDFCQWIQSETKKTIQVSRTTERPVLLKHCLFYYGELYEISQNEKMIPQGFKAAKDKKNSSRGSEPFTWQSFINYLTEKSLLPVLIFCGSKTHCDDLVKNLTKTGLTTATSSEKSVIVDFCRESFAELKESDRNLPQVARIQDLLQRGIGVHHAGLIPRVKEVVEMLFSRGLIKILISIETIAMGVNAPARTVVFEPLRRFDGHTYRPLLPKEYMHMACRAGTSLEDKFGTVIVLCRDEIPKENDLELLSMAPRLESKFRATYQMILNALLLEDFSVEDMERRSFGLYHQFPSHARSREKYFQTNVLKELGFVDKELTLQLKGKVACHVFSGDPILLTEFLFQNILHGLDPAEAAAVISAFLFKDKTKPEPGLTTQLAKAKKSLDDIARKIGRLQMDYNYASMSLNFGLAEVTYKWAKGCEFAALCSMTDVEEGVIIETLKMIIQICKELSLAVTVMGVPTLRNLIDEASNAIERDIVIIGSLYHSSLVCVD